MPDGTITRLDRVTIQTIPSTAGVYLFRKSAGYVYIGKSVNLRARLLSHLENAKKDAKEAAIFQASDRIEYAITDSEFKALIYEAKLIRMHKPHYNVRWRDDKSYLYIKITVKDRYPKISISRREDDTNAKYIGPFSSMQISLRLIREIRKIIPFCTQARIAKQSCFYAKIGLCNPCPNMIERQTDPSIQKRLQTLYRSHIRAVIRILEGKSEIFASSLEKKIQLYAKHEQFEKAIPYRNMHLRLQSLIVRKRFGDDPDEINASNSRQKELKLLLATFFTQPLSLHRIECYDMSTFAFKESTASMVVFTDGLSDKQEYRRFKIKDVKAESDFEMFAEVMRRRFKQSWQLPGLIVVDGGKPQVRTVRRILHEMNIHIPLIGIAKRPDRIIIGDDNYSFVRPPREHKGFILIQSMRDEAHRFAKKYHLLLREKKMML